MVGRCLKQNLGFGVVAQLESQGEDRLALHQVGTLARIVDWYQFDDGLLGITAVGETRFLLTETHRQDDGLNLGHVEFLEPEAPLPMPSRFTALLTLLENVMAELEPQYRFIEKNFEDAVWVSYRLAEVLPLSLEQKQHCLELSDPVRRLETLVPLVESLRR